MDSEIWTDILAGLVALAFPVGLYIAYLDLKDWKHDRHKLMVSRAMTRIGWCMTMGAVALRAASQYPPIEHGPAWLYATFIFGLVLSCAGMLGVARNYRLESEAWSRNYDRDHEDEGRENG